MKRRSFLALLAALAGAMRARSGRAQGARTRLILLGTGGGPRPRANSNASAQVIVAGDALYVVDCGDGVARQLVLAGLSLSNLRHDHGRHVAGRGAKALWRPDHRRQGPDGDLTWR